MVRGIILCQYMKTKWPWLLVPVALAAIAAALSRGSSDGGQISARLASRTLDPSGQIHIVYDVTNGTSSPMDVRASGLQQHQERTGWWDVADAWPTGWH